MANEVEPPELALLLDFAERPRAHNWSLRSALTRYAQPQPGRVGRLIEVVRRTESALSKQNKVMAKQGAALWAAVAGGEADGVDESLVELLRIARALDDLGDLVAAWAADRTIGRPDDEVDTVTEDAGRRLDAIGIPREERQRPGPRGRGV